MRIDRCVCTQRPFADLLKQAGADGLSLPRLIEATGAGACCTMCRPYLCRAYRTGQTTFHQLLSHGDEPEPTADDARLNPKPADAIQR